VEAGSRWQRDLFQYFPELVELELTMTREEGGFTRFPVRPKIGSPPPSLKKFSLYSHNCCIDYTGFWETWADARVENASFADVEEEDIDEIWRVFEDQLVGGAEWSLRCCKHPVGQAVEFIIQPGATFNVLWTSNEDHLPEPRPFLDNSAFSHILRSTTTLVYMWLHVRDLVDMILLPAPVVLPALTSMRVDFARDYTRKVPQHGFPKNAVQRGGLRMPALHSIFVSAQLGMSASTNAQDPRCPRFAERACSLFVERVLRDGRLVDLVVVSAVEYGTLSAHQLTAIQQMHPVWKLIAKTVEIKVVDGSVKVERNLDSELLPADRLDPEP
jgi:hypothetical protein